MADFVINGVGAKQRRHFLAGEQCGLTSGTPDAAHEEFFEWESLRKALDAFEGGRDFVIAELGAGFGRWSVNSVQMLRARYPQAGYKVIAVEADPTHFRWLKLHLADNGIRRKDRRLFRRPITGEPRDVYFIGGDPARWYGQAIVDEKYAKTFPGFLGWLRGTRFHFKRRSVTLTEVLKGIETVDLLDLDVQGAEADVFAHSMSLINRTVRRVHISTHSHEIEDALLALLKGWKVEHFYPCLGVSKTPIGELQFVDGIIAAQRI
jgi:FkbM family methyltransferase